MIRRQTQAKKTTIQFNYYNIKLSPTVCQTLDGTTLSQISIAGMNTMHAPPESGECAVADRVAA
jgi:hypothetical protein